MPHIMCYENIGWNLLTIEEGKWGVCLVCWPALKFNCSLLYLLTCVHLCKNAEQKSWIILVWWKWDIGLNGKVFWLVLFLKLENEQTRLNNTCIQYGSVYLMHKCIQNILLVFYNLFIIIFKLRLLLFGNRKSPLFIQNVTRRPNVSR